MTSIRASSSARTAIIVGAGIGGLAAAIALRRAGWRPRVVERASSPRETGFALNLAANAMAALEELGVADRVVAGGHRTQCAEIRRADGRTLKRVDLPKALAGARAIVAARTVLHGVLLDAAGQDSLLLGSPAVGFETGAEAVTVVLADGRREDGAVLIGADGVGSVIRRQLHPDEPPPRSSGYSAFRGVTDESAHLIAGVSAATYLGPGIEASIARAGSGSVYWYMSLLSSEVAAPELSAAARFAERLDATFRAVVAATAPSDIRFDRLVDRDPLPVWGRGLVTLLGDAAHPMLPHTGQGAAQAIEDAVALGLVLANATDLPVALRRYEQVRSARTRRLVRRGRLAARLTTTRDPVVTSLRTALIRLVPAARMARLPMLASPRDPHRALR